MTSCLACSGVYELFPCYKCDESFCNNCLNIHEGKHLVAESLDIRGIPRDGRHDMCCSTLHTEMCLLGAPHTQITRFCKPCNKWICDACQEIHDFVHRH